jgi:hypothetical protein
MIGLGISIRKRSFTKNFIIIQGFLLKSQDSSFILNNTGGKIIINIRQYI